ncbi:MAG: hypothetical protein PVJ39_12050 [Gammaproteobacteria bacterium]|jgi:hypothetical protein
MKALKLDLMTVLVLFVVAGVIFTMASGFGDGKESKVGVERSFQSSTTETAKTVIPAGSVAATPGAATQSKIFRASTKAIWN